MDLNVFDSDNSEDGVKSSNPQATHLDAPLRDHFILVVLGRKKLDHRIKGFERRRVTLSNYHLRQVIQHAFYSKPHSSIEIGFSRIQHSLFQIATHLNITGVNLKKYMETNRAASNNLNAQSASLSLQTIPLEFAADKEKVCEGIFEMRMILQEGILISGTPNPHINTTLQWETLRDGLWATRAIPGFIIYVTGNLSIIYHKSNLYMGTRDHLLCLHDIITQRGTALLAALLAHNLRDPTYPAFESLMNMFVWGDSILEEEGNQGYNLLGQWESLCVGVLATLFEDPIWDNTFFYRQMEEEFVEGLPQNQKLWNSAVKIVKDAGEQNWNQLTQLYGLYRIWGHPTVNSVEGIKKLKSYACKIKPMNYTMINEVSINMKERFCLDYRMKHNVWPKLDVSALPDSSYLKKCISSNLSIFLKDPRYERYDWLMIKGEKTFDILPKFNLIKLLSDKAMSLDMKEIQSYLARGSIGPSWTRSVLYNWLTTNLGDPVAFLQKISREGFGKDETIVGVCPKERELKLFARMFGLLTKNKRMYVVLTEALLAEHLIPYFPEITMLDSYITLMKKMYSATSQKNEDGFISMYTSLDFSKWNSHMRKEETMHIFTFMDELFGLKNVFTRTHEMFAGQLYLADGTYVPQMGTDGRFIEDEFCWSGHLGGIEGLRQKGWTIFTVCILRMVMDNYGFKYTLMGQGDNQVLKINYPRSMSNQEIQQTHKEILLSMENVLAQIGPPLKLSESWSSSNVFIYGKFTICKGVPMAMSLKRLIRMFSMDNEGFPTLDSSLSSLMANVQSACNYAHDIRLPFYIYSREVGLSIQTFTSFNYLGRHPLNTSQKEMIKYGVPHEGKRILVRFQGSNSDYREIKEVGPKLIEKMLLFPKILGGYSVCLLGNLLSNGFPDPVSENVALLKKIYIHGYHQQTILSILNPQIKPWIEPDLLCEDPVSLNIMHPSSPKESLKRMVQDFLADSSWITNENFTSFVQLAFKRQKPLCQALFSMTPCNPRVMHSIVEATLVGRAIQVVGQLDKTNTLTRMMLMKSHKDANLIIARSEQQYFFSVLCNLYNPHDNNWASNMCSREFAQQLRNRSWQREVTAVTVAPILEAFHLRKVTEERCLGHDNPELGYFMANLGKTFLRSQYLERMTIGDFAPFLGSQTAVKTESFGRNLARKTQPLLKNAAELLNLINWGTKENSNLANLIKDIFASLTDLNPDVFIPSTGQVAGSIEHRWDDASTKHGGNLSILYTSATFFHLSSNTLIGYQAQGVNYNLHFQALMGISVAYINQAILDGYSNSSHMHVACKSCIVPINEEMMDIDPYQKDLIVSIKNNPICWVSSEEVPLLSSVGGDMMTVISLPPQSPLITSAFYWALSERVVGMMRGRTFEAGDGRLKANIMSGMNISWNGKINYEKCLSYIAITLMNWLVFRADAGTYKKWKTQYDLLTHIRHYLANYPTLNFTWSSSFYMNERLMDEMGSASWAVDFPQETPLSIYSVGKHTQDMLVNLLVKWTHDLSEYKLPEVVIAGSAKLADLHPIMRSLLLKMLSCEDNKFLYYKNIYMIMKQLIGNFSMELGNHVNIEWLLRHHLALDIVKNHGNLTVRDVKETIDDCKIMIINNHIDFLAKSSLSAVRAINPETVPEIQELSFLPRTNATQLKLSSSNFSLDNVPYPIREANWSPGSLDIELVKNRRVSYPTTSAYKLLEVLSELEIQPRGNVAALADGAGGFSFLLSRFTEVSYVVYNSWFDLSKSIDQAAPNFIPPAFVGYPEERKKLIGLEYVYDGVSDITDVQYWNQLRIINKEFPISLLCCDAEIGTTGASLEGVNMVRSVLEYSSEMGIQTVLLKTYLNPLKYQMWKLSLCAAFYKRITILNGLWCNSTLKEVYICCDQPLLVPRKIVKRNNLLYGPGVFPKTEEGWFKILSSSFSSSSTFPKVVVEGFESYLKIRLNTHNRDYIQMRMIGRYKSEDYVFPYSYLKDMKIGVNPVRFGKLKRSFLNINLLKQKQLEKWIMGWLLGLISIFQYSPEDIEYVKNHYMIAVYYTKLGWNFWVCKLSKPNLPSTRTLPLSILKKDDIKWLFQTSQYLTLDHFGIARFAGLVNHPKLTPFLLKGILPLDTGINIWDT